MFLKLILRVTPLNASGYKVLEGTHGTNPMGLRGGQEGLEKIHLYTKKLLNPNPELYYGIK